MKKMTTILGLTVLAMALPGASLEAQRGMRGNDGERGVRAERMGQGLPVERLMRLQERLELTEDQMGRLEELRQERLALRQERSAERLRIQSEAAAGTLDLNAQRERRTERRDALRAEMESFQEQLNEVLTLEQREQLLELRSQRMNRGGRDRMRSRARFRGMRERGMRGSAGRRGPGR